MLTSCELFSIATDGSETTGTEERTDDAKSTENSTEKAPTEEVTRIPVSTKDQSTTETKPDSSNTTESTPTPIPPAPDINDTAADAGIGEVLPWDGETGLQ